ncbi:hypothetical protein [Pseudomonas chlororaphis]|uniref:hypothetical protein n=1 Tax=Pseudomonas chlororaphis TaxID=587753 RepID=UPI0003D2DEDF|nr:hypothetical protein [Pseudomonas chlororaphis]AZD29363.1 hypothetical protein C4K23_2614 [Pseudomonas chlororaphis]ETD36724.1 hypothetical protein U724_14340 [Pseudomonas chlororaphis subsp. aurantiaca PB-St2]QFS54856.1 hypothetical protein FD951_09935 [Pseudomonas chlororaphis subsp. aurantiaca]
MSKLSAAEYVLTSFGVVTFLGGGIVGGMYFYLSFTRLDEILGYVKNCKLVNNQRYYLYLGAWGRFLMIGMISGALAYSNYQIKKGLMDAGDVDNFPEPLKRRLIVMFNMQLVFLVCLIVEFIFIKLIRL